MDTGTREQGSVATKRSATEEESENSHNGIPRMRKKGRKSQVLAA
jgi:hypothetical protein